MMAAKNDKKPDRLIWLIMAIGLVVRIVYLQAYQALPDWDQLTVDNYFHHHWAQSIASGNILGDTTYFRAPLYIYLLGGLYSLLGSSLWVGRLLGLIIGLATIGGTFLLGRRVFDARVGLLAAALYTIIPTSIFFESELLLDPLFTLLSLFGLYQFAGWIEYRRTGLLFWAGLIFGLAAITRPTILIFLPIPFLYILLGAPASRRWGSILVMLLGLALTIGPVFARNLAVANDPVLISSQGGINFYIGNNEHSDGIRAPLPEPLGHNWRIEDTRYLAEKDVGKRLSPGQQSDYWFDQGLAWIASHPTEFAAHWGNKLYLYFSSDEFSNNRSIPAFFEKIWLLKYNPFIFGLFFPLALLGLIRSIRGNSSVKLLTWYIALIALVTTLFFVNSRFRLPIIPPMAILASFGILSFTGKFGQSLKQSIPSVLIVAAITVALNLHLVATDGAVVNQDLLSKGIKQIHNANYREAISLLQEARRTDPEFPTINLNLGLCYFRLGQADSAQTYFDREKEFHPQRPKAYFNQASLYLVNDQVDSALQQIDEGLSLRPYDRIGQALKLRALAIAATSENLLQAALEASEITNNDVYIALEALRLFQSRGEFIQAGQFIATIEKPRRPPIETDDTAFDPDWPYSPNNYRRQLAEWHFMLGFVYGNLGDFELSVTNSRKAVMLHPGHSRALQNLIVGFESLGRINEADSVRAQLQTESR